MKEVIFIILMTKIVLVYVKVKRNLYRPEQAQRVPRS